ncbi:hypothetical protein H920_13979 [Fukomys damarensis]|uniref:Uncharacterized protein n=1 Tax=Fukomys damarensis TaxID=885580 RepID=A0A091CXZ4_FUKDA|nr:hypothetical protein H920_13979 [Fukomys damarensis]
MAWKLELEDVTDFDSQEGSDELKGSQRRGKAVGRMDNVSGSGDASSADSSLTVGNLAENAAEAGFGIGDLGVTFGKRKTLQEVGKRCGKKKDLRQQKDFNM